MRWTLAQALAAAAQDVDPEMCRVVDAAGLDLGSFVAAGVENWVADWGLVDVLGDLIERRRKVRVELLRRVRTGVWRLIWLPDSPRDVEQFPDTQVAELLPDNLDAKKCEVILGRNRYRVRIEIGEQTEPKLGPEVTRVRDAMLTDLRTGECSPGALSSNKKSLIGHYRTSRSTYERARDAALAVFSKP